MSTTILPFLYYTRTLSGLSRIAVVPVLSNHVGTPGNRRAFNNSLRTRHPEAHSSPTTASDALETKHDKEGFSISHEPNKLRITRRTNMHGAEPPTRGSWDLKDPEEHSYEDNFAMLNPIRIRKYWDRKFEEKIDSQGEFLIPEEDIEFDEDLDDLPENIPRGDEIQDLTMSSSTRDSTITDSERYAFQRIFESILKRPEQNEAIDQLPDHMQPTYDPTTAQAKLQDILSSAVHVQNVSQNIEEAVNRYPPALRLAAAKAFGLIRKKAEAGDDSTDGNLSQQKLQAAQYETLREPERARVGGLMRATESDFELWEVLEKEVFPLIKKLGLEENGKPKSDLDVLEKKRKLGGQEKKKKSKSKSKNKKQGDGVQSPELALLEAKIEENDTPLHMASMLKESGLSPLTLYAPLYPEYLLLALRLLDRSFSQPSPLALSILPKVKSLGFISHVLGGSTQLYNELLRIYGFRLENFPGMLGLLREMEHSALEFNEDTLQLIVGTIRSHRNAALGYSGEAVQALWGMPEFDISQFRTWREKIKFAIFEKTVETRAKWNYVQETSP